MDSEASLAPFELSSIEPSEEEEWECNKNPIIVEALAKGIAINVNDAPWQRVLVHIDEQTDEAVIVIYGLMPGRPYEIELKLLRAGATESVTRQVITEATEYLQTSPKLFGSSVDPSDHSPPSLSPASTSPNRSSSPLCITPSTPPHLGSESVSTQPTLEERLQQLQSSLSLLTSERDSLAASLKAARRDSQKADAALRSEIDILKKASEKNSVAEHRGRQKILALQEAVKRGQTGTQEIEEMIGEIERDLPTLEEQRDGQEDEYRKLKEEVDKVEREREKEAEKERKRADGMKAELHGLGNKLEKLKTKRDKLESCIIVDLEQQLGKLELELRNIESDPYGYFTADLRPPHELVESPSSEKAHVSFPVGSHTHLQTRMTNANTRTAIGRPSLTPTQRPVQSSIWATPISPQASPSRQDRSPSHSPTKPFSELMSHGSSPQASLSTQLSTLSVRAPPFEPNRNITQVLRPSFPTPTTGVVPIHRPRPTPANVHAQRASGRGDNSEGS